VFGSKNVLKEAVTKITYNVKNESNKIRDRIRDSEKGGAKKRDLFFFL